MVTLKFIPNGPAILRIEGLLKLYKEDGIYEELKPFNETATNIALCRCGKSLKGEFCDGSHKNIKAEVNES